MISERKDKVLYRDGDKTIKLFSEDYSKSNVLNEAINQSRVEETGLNIPKIREVTFIDGRWAIVMDYIDGDTLESLIRANPEKESEYIRRFINIQKDIHSRKHLLLTKFVDKMILKIMNSELDASTRYDFCTRLNDMPRHACVCHGDFNPSNVIIGADDKAYILDWSHASQGSPTADATKTYLIFDLAGEKERAEIYLDNYCKSTNTDKRDIFRWIPLVAAAQLVKVKPDVKNRLMYWINKSE